MWSTLVGAAIAIAVLVVGKVLVKDSGSGADSCEGESVAQQPSIDAVPGGESGLAAIQCQQRYAVSGRDGKDHAVDDADAQALTKR